MTTTDTPSPTVPPVECKPWCFYGDGHPGEWHPDDQWCGTHHRIVKASMLPEEPWTDGTWQSPSVEVAGMQRPDGEPFVDVALDGHPLVQLTLDETATLAEHLLATVRQVRP